MSGYGVSLSDEEFSLYQAWAYKVLGISLGGSKRALVAGRLAKRIRETDSASYGDYLNFICSAHGLSEKKIAMDLLTTNETWFFREPAHFDFLADYLSKYKDPAEFRVWSAASSSGEEAYSIAMTMSDKLGSRPWSIFGSDVSLRVLESARSGIFDIDRAEDIPEKYLKRFCLKGIGDQAGKLMISDEIRNKLTFSQVNLIENIPDVGNFNMIWLRNCLIYFDQPSKKKIVAKLINKLKPGGIFILGHSESVSGFSESLSHVKTAVYRRLGD